jgi:hypothetical protein
MRTFLGLLCLCSHFLYAEQAEMMTVNYILEDIPAFEEYTTGGGGGKAVDPFGFGAPARPMESDLPWARKTANPEFLQQYFTQHLGIEFPEGSWMNFQRAGNVLTMHNTLTQHAWLKIGLIKFHLLPSQIQINLRMVSFKQDMIDKLERQHPAGIPDALIVALWQKGEGETIASQSVKTINGVNAIIECVDDVTYPTSMILNRKGQPGDAAVPGYESFETRKVGVILNVTPVQNSSLQNFNLVILPEKVEHRENPDKMNPELRPMIPIFRNLNITTSVVLGNGGTLVLGHSSSMDHQNRIFLMVSVQMMDAKGGPVNFPKRDAEEVQP